MIGFLSHPRGPIRSPIALHSPTALLKPDCTGALRRKGGTVTLCRQAVRSLKSGLLVNNREIRALFAYFGVERAEILCSSDLLAERAVWRYWSDPPK
jgi:hypothetical protein